MTDEADQPPEKRKRKPRGRPIRPASQRHGADPRIKPTPQNADKIRSMAAYGTSNADIAKIFGVAEKTLSKQYRNELSLGRSQAKATLLQTGYQMAVGQRLADGTWREVPDKALLIFLLKTRCGLSELRKFQQVDEAGMPMQPVQVNISGTGEAAKPVMVVPGTWTEETWLVRARQHRDAVLRDARARSST